MKRIAIVNQRYGREVNGGSESYTMQLAEHMREEYEVEVLTTQALSYATWENHYKEREEWVDGVRVRRFPVKRRRQRLLLRITGRLITALGMNYRWLNRIWIKAQGPYAPELLDFIEENRESYDVFIFVTYLYYPAVFGLGLVGEKSVFVPTAHEEPYIHFKLMEDVFGSPAAYVFLTEEERELVFSLFPVSTVPNRVAAMGIAPRVGEENLDFKKKYGISGSYLIYAGRIDVDKGCGQLIEYFERYCQSCSREEPMVTLVLIGKSEMALPEGGHVRYLGFLSEEDKNSGIAGAKALCLPSRHESLSMAALEAMYLGTPIIVNGDSPVLQGHCRRSGGGLSYRDYKSFREALEAMWDEGKYRKMKESGIRYVEENYRWETVLDQWKEVIAGVIKA